jgi:ABC-type glycerol-3-phosphate transport system substrate-binding protein
MQRILRLAGTVACISLFASACSGTSDLGSNSGKPLAGQTVEVAAVWSGVEQANFQTVLDAFTAKTGATVKYTSGGNDLATLINSRLAGGAPPDVALLAQPGVVAQFAKQGVLKELTGEAASAVTANFSPAWKQLGEIDGKLYGVYFKVANKSVIWYRTDKFTEAGVKPPSTWEELTSVSKTLSDAGITPMAVPGGDGWTLTDWFENVYLRIAGSEKYDQLSKHKLAWTDPTVVQTLQMLKDYWGTAKAIQGGRSGAVQLTFTQSIADVFGEKPQSAMLFEGDFVGSEITKLGKVKVGTGAKFFNWPSINSSKPAVVTAGDQAVAFKDTGASRAFVAFLASPEAAKLMAAKGGYMSANKNLDMASYPDDTTRQLADAVVKADLLRFDLSDLTPQSFGGGTTADMWKLLQTHLGDANSDPAAIAQKLEDAAKKAYGSN